jgi:hypothetical protein
LTKELNDVQEKIAKANEQVPSKLALLLANKSLISAMNLAGLSDIAGRVISSRSGPDAGIDNYSEISHVLDIFEGFRSEFEAAKIKVSIEEGSEVFAAVTNNVAKIVTDNAKTPTPFDNFVDILEGGLEFPELVEYIVTKYSAQLSELFLVESVDGETLLGRIVNSPLMYSNFSLKYFVPQIYNIFTSVDVSLPHLFAMRGFGRYADTETMLMLMNLLYSGDANFLDSFGRSASNSRLASGENNLLWGIFQRLGDVKDGVGVEKQNEVIGMIKAFCNKSKLPVASLGFLHNGQDIKFVCWNECIRDAVTGVLTSGVRLYDYEKVKLFVKTLVQNKRISLYDMQDIVDRSVVQLGNQDVQVITNAVIAFLTLLRGGDLTYDLYPIFSHGLHTLLKGTPENVFWQIMQTEYDPSHSSASLEGAEPSTPKRTVKDEYLSTPGLYNLNCLRSNNQ